MKYPITLMIIEKTDLVSDNLQYIITISQVAKSLQNIAITNWRNWVSIKSS
jgi:hypothetical protein